MYPIVLAFILAFFITAHPAKAVPPPDFIFNVTTQIAQFFSIGIIFISAVGSTFFRFFKDQIRGKKRLLFWAILAVSAVGLSAGGAWMYGQYAQQQAYEQWFAEANRASQQRTATTEDGMPVRTDDLDQLPIGVANTTEPTEEADDAVAEFIRSYYQAIADHQFDNAYAMSKKSVSFEIFKGWYTNTNAITIDRLQRIDETHSSLQLTLTEGKETTRYGVLMTVRLDEQGQPVQVEQSTVRTLSETPEETREQITTQDEPLAISNDEFKQTVSGSTNGYYILDARENIEFENGHYPGAQHIRFADLKSGRWIELPTDRPVFVLCWSGIRGKEVAEFLKTKRIQARYLETGVDGWVSSGGSWTGEVAFLKVFTDDRYKKVFSIDDVERKMESGAILVDSRSPLAYQEWHIPGSISIPLMYTPTISLESSFAQVPPHSTIITVCDEYVNCFYAKLTGVELERRGHTFLGRFVEPWKLK